MRYLSSDTSTNSWLNTAGWSDDGLQRSLGGQQKRHRGGMGVGCSRRGVVGVVRGGAAMDVAGESMPLLVAEKTAGTRFP